MIFIFSVKQRAHRDDRRLSKLATPTKKEEEEEEEEEDRRTFFFLNKCKKQTEER